MNLNLYDLENLDFQELSAQESKAVIGGGGEVGGCAVVGIVTGGVTPVGIVTGGVTPGGSGGLAPLEPCLAEWTEFLQDLALAN